MCLRIRIHGEASECVKLLLSATTSHHLGDAFPQLDMTGLNPENAQDLDS